MKYAKHGNCKLADYLNIVFYVRTAIHSIKWIMNLSSSTNKKKK